MHKLSEWDPLSVQKRKKRTDKISQHKDSSVSSVTLGSFSKSYFTF